MPDLNKLTISEALEGLKKGDFTSLDLTNDCLSQIEKYDDSIKALITVTKDHALERAKKADEIISKNGAKAFENNALLGIPYVVKDNISTKGILTTSSSKVLDNYVPPFDATLLKRLNDAGAVLLGKANMDAFAHGSSTETSDFFTTKNPWDLTKVPGGSSGGSAAAVISDMCLFAIGTETAGSIRCPASWCGITGLKPTYGRVSRYGITAMASSTDSPGPMTKCALDAALVLNVIAGNDYLDATTSSKPVKDYKNFEKFSFKGLKIGKPRSYFELDLEPEVKSSIENAINTLKDLGAEIIDMDLLDPNYSIAVYTILQRAEVSSNLGRLDGIRYGNPRSDFGFEAKKRIMLGAYALSAGYYDEFYGKAQKVRTLIVDDFNKAFEDVDLIIGPAMPCVAMDIGAADTSPLFGELIDLLNEPSSIAGIPGITVPCGYGKGLPVGLMLLADKFQEDLLLKAANNYQEVTDFHKERPSL